MREKQLGVMPIVILIALASLGTAIAVLVGYRSVNRQASQTEVKELRPAYLDPTPFAASSTPSPTQAVSPIYRPDSNPTPTHAKKFIPTNTPAPTATNTPLPTPTVFVDTAPPTLTIQGGPADGSTITDFNNFCFPLYVSDNISRYPNIFVRYRFDSDSWNPWTTDVSPCYNNVSNGQHTFAVQTKDEAGNISSEQKRTFTLNLPN